MIVEEPEDRVRVEERRPRRQPNVPVWCVLVWYPFEQWNTIRSTHNTEAEANAEAERIRTHFNEH